MLFNTFSNHENILGEEPSSKVTSSQGTDVSEPLPLSKQISLRSCPSSLSLPEQSQHREENELFAPYLFAETPRQQKLAYEAMQNHFQLINQEDDQTRFKFQCSSLEGVSEEDQVLGYFISHWFIFMGYCSSNNKKYFVNRVKAMAGTEQMQIYTKIYKNVTLLGLSRHQLNQFLVETCRNGWEYFIRQIVAKVEKSQIAARV